MLARQLSGGLLNFWVAKAMASAKPSQVALQATPDARFQPATDWSHAGPILADEWYGIEDVLLEWMGHDWSQSESFRADPLGWFMRAYVCTQFGQEVEDLPRKGPARPMSATIASWLDAWGW